MFKILKPLKNQFPVNPIIYLSRKNSSLNKRYFKLLNSSNRINSNLTNLQNLTYDLNYSNDYLILKRVQNFNYSTSNFKVIF
jgi:hypothetical protein